MKKIEKEKKKKLIRTLILLILSAVITCFITIVQSYKPKEITYDKVISYIESNEVSKIQIEETTNLATIFLKDGIKYNSRIPSIDDISELISEKIQKGTEIEFEILEHFDAVGFTFSLIKIVFWIILITIFISSLKGVSHQFNFGDDVELKPVTSTKKFTDVAGIDEEKAQVEEIVTFLKTPEKYKALGAKIPKGILLTGAPGTGKTLLAKAIAGEAGVPFYQFNGSSFEEKFVGVGASRIRKVFSEAKKNSPCIIFIDEIDSVAKARYSGSNSEQTLNQLLSEMDGFDTDNNVIVIAATNHLDVLDPAITRPGRFDRQVYVPMPDMIAREAILKVHAKGKPLSEDVNLNTLAKKAIGFSGADLENILNESAILATNSGDTTISQTHIDEAFARVVVGLEKKNSAVKPEDRKLTAIHEAGHAIVSAILRPNVANLGISIVPRGKAGGYNLFNEEESIISRKQDMLLEICVLYGGRVAEEFILKEISSGALNDFEKASNIANKMVTHFAMAGTMLTMIPGNNNFNKQLTESTFETAEKICKDAYDRTVEIIAQNESVLLKLSELLIEKEVLSAEEVTLFMEKHLW